MDALVQVSDPLALMGISSDRALAEIEELEGVVLKLPQVELPVKHHFAPGIYMRELFAPAGSFVIGAEHTTDHQNILLEGEARALVNNRVQNIVGPSLFVSKAGTRKLVIAVTDIRWLNIHPNPDNETDVAALEARFVKFSPTLIAHRAALEAAKQKQPCLSA